MAEQDLLETLKLDQDPGYEYGNILPLKWQPGNSASLRPAVPGFLRDQYNELLSLAQDAGGAYRPGDNIDPEKLLSLAGTGAIAGTMVPKNALGMFAGRFSMTADLEAQALAKRLGMGQLSQAEQGRLSSLEKMTRAETPLSDEQFAEKYKLYNKQYGNTPEQINATRNPIFDTTGWFKGRDGKWRYEISDDKAGLKLNKFNTTQGINEPYYSIPYNMGNNVEKSRTLGDLLDHKELFDAYPHLKSMPVEPVPLSRIFDVKGAFDPINKKFYLGSGSAEDVKSTLLHEVQHAVQDHEGFASGANTNMFLPEGFAEMTKPLSQNYSVMKDRLQEQGINYITADRVIKKLGSGDTLMPFEAKTYDQLKNSGLLKDWHEAVHQYEPVRLAQKAAADQYYATHGEAEARNTEYRAGMTPFMRAQEKPWDTLNYMDHPQDESKLIVLGQDGKPRLAQQVDHDPFAQERATAGQDLAQQGRLGDTLVGHLTPGDAVIPAEVQNNPRVKELLQEIYSLTGTDPRRFTAGAKGNKTNPKTGLPEFEDGGDGNGGGDGSASGGSGGSTGGGTGNGGGDGAAGDGSAGTGDSGPGPGGEGGPGSSGPGGGGGDSFQPSAAAVALPKLTSVQAPGPKSVFSPTITTPLPTGLQPSAASPTSQPGTDLLNRLLQVAGSPLAQTNNFASQLNDLLKLQSGIYAPGG